MSDVQAETIEAQGPWPAGHYQDAEGRHWLHQIHNGSAYGAPDRYVDQWLNYRGKIANPPLDELVRLVPVAAGVLVDDHNDDGSEDDYENTVDWIMEMGISRKTAERSLAWTLAGRRSAVVPKSNEREAIAFERGKRTVLATAPGLRDLIDYGNPYTPDRNNAVVPERKLGDALGHNWTEGEEEAFARGYKRGWEMRKSLDADADASAPSTDHSVLTRVDYSKAPRYLIALRDRETWADGYNAAVAALEGGTK